MNKSVPIVLSGSIAIDRTMNFRGSYEEYIHPEKLESLSISVFLDSLTDSYGGICCNIAHTLNLLGEKPILVGSVGPDGKAYMDNLAAKGIETSYVYMSKLPTASFNVITDSNQNQVGGFYPGAMFDSDSLSFKQWADTEAIMVVSAHDPKAMRRQVTECQTLGLRLCYDPGQQVINMPAEDMAAGVEVADMLILNEYEITTLCKKIGISTEKLKSKVPIVITTLGGKGSEISGKTIPDPIHITAVPPKEIVDPTGAGDAFRGGFLYGIAHGWDLQTSCRLGATCGTYAIETKGTQSYSFNRKDIGIRYSKHFNEALPLKEE